MINQWMEKGAKFSDKEYNGILWGLCIYIYIYNYICIIIYNYMYIYIYIIIYNYIYIYVYTHIFATSNNDEIAWQF